ncbi:hypothetical protein KSP40_PGU015715 [Platanthera guangdongensis]|uniref:Uncharacterized protein n=1 Tax=Platanthera guangdongensis TaxID=2320717 RepID=A0ABR2LUP7_9ASPA
MIALCHFVTGVAALNYLLSGDTLKAGQSLSEASRSLPRPIAVAKAPYLTQLNFRG